MPSIGVRELKNQTNEIVRSVREEQAEYIITYHGQPVAVILPIDRAPIEAGERAAIESAQPRQETLDELDALRQEIEQSWRSKKTGAELIRGERR
jgi:prevent-host-death family protein